jgi:hypothetical protein
MNASSNPRFLTRVLILAAVSAACAGAQELKTLDHLTVEKGVVIQVKGGQREPLKEAFALPDGSKVQTNGVLVFAGAGGERKLAEGRKLTMDGFYLNGELLVPLADHLLAQAGRAVIYRDGQPSPVSGEVVLGNGTRVQDNVMVVRPNGQRFRMQDGQQFTLTGTPLPAFDHIMNVGGRVLIQKEGSIIQVEPRRTLVMNDGTRVTGAGEIATRDDRKFTLTDGQRLTLPGIRFVLR